MTHHKIDIDPWLPPELQDESDLPHPDEETDDGYDDNGNWNDFPSR